MNVLYPIEMGYTFGGRLGSVVFVQLWAAGLFEVY